MKVLEISVIIVLLFWAFSRLLKSIFNLIAFYEAQNDPSSPHWREGSGLVFNKETCKIEAPSPKVLLPFE